MYSSLIYLNIHKKKEHRVIRSPIGHRSDNLRPKIKLPIKSKISSSGHKDKKPSKSLTHDLKEPRGRSLKKFKKSSRELSARGRGRPKKCSPEDLTAIAKRGRGRPKKNPIKGKFKRIKI